MWHQLRNDGFAQFGPAKAQEFGGGGFGRVEGVFDLAGFCAAEAFFVAQIGGDGGIVQACDESAAFACRGEGFLQVGLRVKAEVQHLLAVGGRCGHKDARHIFGDLLHRFSHVLQGGLGRACPAFGGVAKEEQDHQAGGVIAVLEHRLERGFALFAKLVGGTLADLHVLVAGSVDAAVSPGVDAPMRIDGADGAFGAAGFGDPCGKRGGAHADDADGQVFGACGAAVFFQHVEEADKGGACTEGQLRVAQDQNIWGFERLFGLGDCSEKGQGGSEDRVQDFEIDHHDPIC